MLGQSSLGPGHRDSGKQVWCCKSGVDKGLRKQTPALTWSTTLPRVHIAGRSRSDPSRGKWGVLISGALWRDGWRSERDGWRFERDSGEEGEERAT